MLSSLLCQFHLLFTPQKVNILLASSEQKPFGSSSKVKRKKSAKPVQGVKHQSSPFSFSIKGYRLHYLLASAALVAAAVYMLFVQMPIAARGVMFLLLLSFAFVTFRQAKKKP